MLRHIKQIIKRLPIIREVIAQRDQLLIGNLYPPGHFSSPIPSQEEMRSFEHVIWGEMSRHLPSIDLNEGEQMALFKEFANYYPDVPFKEERQQHLRYFFDNTWFCYADAIVLYCMIRHYKPKKIIEIGSGFSSAVMLDTNELFCNDSISCTFIEPDPARLLPLLKESDYKRHSIVTTRIQAVPLEMFQELGPNDILFIDSSHVSKIHSDVNQILFEVMPVLNKGVLVHFHDIFCAFEYPKDWVFNGMALNEAYLLRAFLQYNSDFAIQFFNSYLAHFYRDRFQQEMPLCLRNSGGSIWLRKLKATSRADSA